ncbi:pyridoxamine 5'-phosphate oxidase family protein [Actinomadura latina]|uniref:Pyridoxamine 5'-phosphate oxidase family protein n=1 Tax=Actinomadura latina TaxID=163603 RepID=A0A846ZC85_9ACTN|nr:pyridoxamine 5'-phosphate oxidase family protein [Actinomadura latina]NKZ08053.1 pyridoxamine 5'-phosphate oxidase family protein [Actinomadura latina]
MQLDQSGLQHLDEDECRALLARAVIGRIVFTHQALPAVQPVNFVLSRGDIVIKVSRRSRLATAAADTVVAFEIDDYDTEAETGWSVVAVGRARRVTDPREITALESLPLRTWAPVERDTFIRVRPEFVTGRRIGSATEATAAP